MPRKKTKESLAQKKGKRTLTEFAAELQVDASMLSRALNHGQIGYKIKARCLELYGWPLEGWE